MAPVEDLQVSYRHYQSPARMFQVTTTLTRLIFDIEITANTKIMENSLISTAKNYAGISKELSKVLKRFKDFSKIVHKMAL